MHAGLDGHLTRVNWSDIFTALRHALYAFYGGGRYAFEGRGSSWCTPSQDRVCHSSRRGARTQIARLIGRSAKGASTLSRLKLARWTANGVKHPTISTRACRECVLPVHVDHRGEPSSTQSVGQETEAILACNILNQMTRLGRPASYARSLTGLWVGGGAGQFSNRATTPRCGLDAAPCLPDRRSRPRSTTSGVSGRRTWSTPHATRSCSVSAVTWATTSWRLGLRMIGRRSVMPATIIPTSWRRLRASSKSWIETVGRFV